MKNSKDSNHSLKYRSNLTVRKVPSKGLVSRIKSHITKRIYHVLSGLELSVFCMVEWANEVSDFYMQVELDLEETLWIADQLGVKHPTDPKLESPVVETTDFIICIETGLSEIQFAIEVKPSKDLDPLTRSGKRHLEKLEIKRRYWEARNVNFMIMTEKEISKDLEENVEHIRKYMHENIALPIQQHLLSKVYIALTEPALKGHESLTEIAANCADKFSLKKGDCLAFAWYLIATRRWEVDINKAIDPSKSISFLLQPSLEF